MKTYIKNNISNIISIFILLSPFIDLVTGINIHNNINITLGVIYRLLVLGILFLIVTIIYKKKKLLIPYLIVVIYILLFLLVNDKTYLIKELQGALRVFYFPLILVTLFNIKDEFKISNNILIVTLVEYTLLLFIPNILGLGYNTYSESKVGHLGFFASANEIGGILSLLIPILFINIKERIIPKIIFILIYLYVILNIGTKTPILVFIMTILTLYLYLISVWKKERKIKYIKYSILVIILVLSTILFILPKTNFYKNIKIHLNYLHVEKITDLTKPKIIDHFIFSSRLKFKDNKQKLYDKSSLSRQLFGIGYINGNKEIKDAEMDFYDIGYSNGTIGLIIFFGITIYVLRNIKTNANNITRVVIKLELLLILLLSGITGHILTSPSVSFIAAIIILITTSNKKELLFASYNMDIGGIEKALLTLVNKIDKNKYRVTIVLEKKEGIFLDKLDKNIKVIELRVSNNKNIFIRKFTNMFRKEIFRLFNNKKYDFSCCYATYSYSSNKVALIASNNRMIYIHNDYTHIYKEKELNEFFDTRNLGDYRYITFVSNESKNNFTKVYKKYKENYIVINNFVDVSEIIEKSSEKIDCIKKNRTMIFVGRLDEHQKRITRLLKIIKLLKNVDLWIVGDGPDKQMYKAIVTKEKLNDRVTFLGKKSNPFPYIKESDYIIFTSDYEGFPVTYLESIVLNKPVITTQALSDDLVKINDYGYKISKDENEAVKEIKEIFKSKKTIKYKNLNNVQNKRMKKLESIFNEVI